ncbi:hypothetical protein C5C67_08555 [Rathayibacter sp. AY1E1]|nr:hypothetical protein C5C67_08555 [Rathayibacter sp. AY1E1]
MFRGWPAPMKNHAGDSVLSAIATAIHAAATGSAGASRPVTITTGTTSGRKTRTFVAVARA